MGREPVGKWAVSYLANMELKPDSILGLIFGGAALVLLVGLTLHPVLRMKNAQWRFRYGSGKFLRTLHLYGGIAFLALMWLHAGFGFPQGWITGLLFWGMLLLSLTGGVWWLLQKMIPPRLAALNRNGGEIEVLFERIPGAHALLLKRGNELQMHASPTLRNFYDATWLPLMCEIRFSREYFFALPVDELTRSADVVKTMLRAEERDIIDELHRLYLRKQYLEASYSLQLVLKKFHLAHGPMAFVLLALALVHAFIR